MHLLRYVPMGIIRDSIRIRGSLRLMLVLSALAVSSHGALAQEDSGASPLQELKATVTWQGGLEARALNESSGLAASHRHPNVLWSINDSGSKAVLYAMDLTGRHLGSWSIDMPDPVDWEAMTSVQVNGTSYLVVADVGDNTAWRDTVSYTVVAEPDVFNSAESILEPVSHLRFRYPDGPRDCEAVTVDVQGQRLLLMSKRVVPIEVYALPLVLDNAHSDVFVAEKIADLDGLPRVSVKDMDLYGKAGPWMHMPTGMTLSGDRLLVITPKDAYLFSLARLLSPPQRIAMPSIGQREAIVFAAGSENVAFVSHERRYGKEEASLLRIEIKDR